MGTPKGELGFFNREGFSKNNGVGGTKFPHIGGTEFPQIRHGLFPRVFIVLTICLLDLFNLRY